MNRTTSTGVVVLLVLAGGQAFAQHHSSNWVHRFATDTTLVPCWTDSLIWIRVPPNSMNTMFPDSMFMRIDPVHLDSLPFPHDSTFIGWCSIQAGRDSTHFNLMHWNDGHSNHHMMQFMSGLHYHFHWDSTYSDSLHMRWTLTGVRGWNGAAWETVPGVVIMGNEVEFTSPQTRTAIAFVGIPSIAAGVDNRRLTPALFTLEQNYPNPFNPSTSIKYELPTSSMVKLIVYDILGREVSVLVNERREAGIHEVQFDASGLTSGVYLYRLQVHPLDPAIGRDSKGGAGDFVETRKLLLLR